MSPAADPGESLELVPDAFSFYIGPTGAADVQLLRKAKFDSRSVTRSQLPGLDYRRIKQTRSSEGTLYPEDPIFGITDKSLLENAEPRLDGRAIDDAWSDIWKVFDSDTAWRLIRLYSRFVDPYFPILARQQLPESPDTLSNMPLCLLAALCASALPFVVHDESLYRLLLHPPSSAQLYRICWLDISHDLHAPTLTTLQACLLLQQRLPTNAYLSDTAFSWTLMSTAVAVAQTLGLHRDPVDWISVPAWERRLRRRLWWAVWMMEKWLCLVRGMPSHIHDVDYDVGDLEKIDITDSLARSPQEPSHDHFYQMVKLTEILNEIQQTYYTVRSMKTTSSNLQMSLDLARKPRAQLKAWLGCVGSSMLSLPDDSAHPNMSDGGSLRLAYLVTHMTLFRALLRPLGDWHIRTDEWPIRAETLHDGSKAVVKGSLMCVREFVEFLEGLRDPQWNAFWHSWSRANFAIAGSFMVQLLHMTVKSTNELENSFSGEDAELKALVRRWRVANRTAANGAAGSRGLANLGLLRVETMLGKLVPAGLD